MNCITRVGWLTLTSVAVFAGCSKSASTAATATVSADGNQPTAQTDIASNPAARAASEWFDAVLKGDTQRAGARLTPQAMQRVIDNKETFSPPGIECEGFQVGEIRTPSEDQAIVQCVLNYTKEGKHHSEEMCCLLRRIENDWRVSGIAYGTAPDKPWTFTNFETGEDVAVPRQAMSEANASNAGPNGAESRPSPPRTAQETPATSPAVQRQ